MNFLKCFYLLLLGNCVLFLNINAHEATRQYLHNNWNVRQTSKTIWIPAIVPGSVHQSLLSAKKITNPFYANNAASSQWMENEDWEYSTYFDLTEALQNKKNLHLILEEIDTYGEIKLNGKVLGTTDNMFLKYAFDISNIAQKKNNVLSITLHSAAKKAKELEQNHKIKLPTDNRIFTRKAAYQYGWDFAPRLVGAGICNPIYLQVGKSAEATGLVSVKPMAKLDIGRFAFVRFGKPVFIKGANFIPPNAITYNASKAYYDSLMILCKKANINMLRVWGGGIYPDDYFYEVCDKNKIMVWQDLMFANAMPPIDFNFSFSVLQEVRQQVRRLAHHPCIVLWCGNNEIDEGWNNWGWQKDLLPIQKTELYKNYKQLFEVDIPNTIAQIDTARAYIPSSPKFGWGTKQSMQNGDAHYWGVWWGKEPIEKYYEKVPRFMSEYGMQALPDIQTIHKMCDTQDIKMDKINFKTHQKLDNGFETINNYLHQYYPAHNSNEAYIYYTQLMQKEAITKAVSAHRSAFPYCNGTMLWQLNDCWPGITWSVIDFLNKPKASYYALSELYGTDFLAVSKQIFEKDSNVVDTNKYAYAMSFNEAGFDITKATTMFTVYDFYGGILYSTDKINWQKTTNGVYYTLPFFDKKVFESFNWPMSYLVVDVFTKTSSKLHKSFTFSPLKDLQLQYASLQHTWLNDTTLEISCNMFAKDIYLGSSNDRTTFNKNYFDVLPNEKYTISVNNFNQKTDSLILKSAVDMRLEL